MDPILLSILLHLGGVIMYFYYNYGRHNTSTLSIFHHDGNHA